MRRKMKHQRFFLGFVGSCCFLSTAGFCDRVRKQRGEEGQAFRKAKEYIAKNELRKAVIELKNVVQLPTQ